MPASFYETMFAKAAAPQHLLVFGIDVVLRVFDVNTRQATDTVLKFRTEDQIFAIEDTKQNSFFVANNADLVGTGVKRGDHILLSFTTGERFEILDINVRNTGMTEFRCLRAQDVS